MITAGIHAKIMDEDSLPLGIESRLPLYLSHSSFILSLIFFLYISPHFSMLSIFILKLLILPLKSAQLIIFLTIVHKP